MSAAHPDPRRHPAQLRAVATGFLRRRPWIVAPALLTQSLLLATSDAPRAQVAAVLTGFTLILAFFTWEARRGRSVQASDAFFARSLLVTLLGITFGVFATGAIASPLLPVLFAPVVVAFAAFGRAPEARRLGATAALILCGMLCIPLGFPFPPLAPGTARPMAAVASLTALALLWAGVGSLADAYAHAGDALADAGGELLDAAQARHRAMEAMGAQVAHELKNPLTAIKGLADLLAERAERPEDRAKLDVMSGEVARIERVLRDYLSFSRPLGVVRREPVELDAALRPFEQLLGHRAERAGIRLGFEGAPLRARLDPRRLKEAVLNLTLNALEATPRGGEVRVRWSAAEGGCVVIVEDTGEGMSDEALARAGEAFFTTRAEGTGLGVALARRVAEEHHGRLEFERVPTGGTRAILTLGDDTP